MSEFKQFFKNYKTRKDQALCAITFGGAAIHLKVIAAFKLQKIMFFERFDKASIFDVEKMNFCDLKSATSFRWVAIPPKAMAHNTSSFLLIF